MDFHYLPEEYRTIHYACFELVRQIEEFIVGKEYRFLQESHYELSDAEKDCLKEYDNVWDFLRKFKEEDFYNLLNKQMILGLLMDFCYFMQESMACSCKMRLVVSFALLRRPLVDNLKILLRMFADEKFYENFIERDDYDPAKMEDSQLKEFLDATDQVRIVKPITGSFIYECVFDKENSGSIFNLSNRALHPVTTRPWNKTGAMNCNFMFVNPDDTLELWKQYYACLPEILMFYSELFNCLIFALFKDDVDSKLLNKRLERMAKVISNAYSKEEDNN